MKESSARNIINSLQSSYSRIAPHFSETRAVLWPELKEFLPRIKAGDCVLDIGCGNGRLCELFKDTSVEYCGVDAAVGLLEEARKKYPKAMFVQDNMLTLEHVDGEFDHAFMIASLHHIPSRKLRLQALEAARAHLKPGGYLYITVWNLHQPRFRPLRFKSNLKTLLHLHDLDLNDVYVPWKDSSGKVLANRYYHAFTMKELRELLEAAGFAVERMWYAKNGKVVDSATGHNLCVVARTDK